MSGGWFDNNIVYQMSHNRIWYTVEGEITSQKVQDYLKNLGIEVNADFYWCILPSRGETMFDINVIGQEDNIPVSVTEWNQFVKNLK